MKSLFVIALLAILSALAAAIKMKVMQATGAGSGGPSGSTPGSGRAYLSREEATQLMNNIDSAEATLRRFYHSTMGTDPYEGVTCPVVEETHDCGGPFVGNHKNLMVDPIIDPDSSMVMGSRPNEDLKAYIFYTLSAIHDCMDPATKTWNSEMTSGFRDPVTKYYSMRFGHDFANSRNWNITLFRGDGTAGCIKVWNTPQFSVTGYGTAYGHPMGGIGGFYNGMQESNQVLSTICWDEGGDCRNELEVNGKSYPSPVYFLKKFSDSYVNPQVQQTIILSQIV